MMLNKMREHRKMVAALMCAAVLGTGLLAGCASGGGNAPAPEASSAPAAAVETSEDTSAAVVAMIEAGDAAAPASFMMANALGDKITSIELAPVADGVAAEFEAYPFTVGDSLAPDQEAVVHFAGDADAYDMRLTMMDGTEYTVHSMPFASVESPVIVQAADGIAYTVFELDGAQINTLETETEIAAAAAAEEVAEATDEYAEDAYDPTYEDSYDYGYEESYDYGYSYGGGAQGEEGCVSDIVLR